MHQVFPTITDLRDPALTQSLRAALDNKTKPLGSLGRLESLAVQLGEILGSHNPVLDQPQMVVFAGDHGITAQGVSAFPSEVSWQMVENFLAGGAAVSVLARQHGLALTVVDCGVKHDFLAGLPAGAQRAGLDAGKRLEQAADEVAGAGRCAGGGCAARGLSAGRTPPRGGGGGGARRLSSLSSLL